VTNFSNKNKERELEYNSETQYIEQINRQNNDTQIGNKIDQIKKQMNEQTVRIYLDS